MELAGDVFKEGRKKDLAFVLRIVLFGKHPVDMHDFYPGKTKARVEFRKKGQHIPGQ